MGTRLGNQLTRIVQRITVDMQRRDELIAQMHAAGWSYAEIGECADLSKAGVRYILVRQGVVNGD